MGAGSRAQLEKKVDILRVIKNCWVRIKKPRKGLEFEVFNAAEKWGIGGGCIGKSCPGNVTGWENCLCSNTDETGWYFIKTREDNFAVTKAVQWTGKAVLDKLYRKMSSVKAPFCSTLTQLKSRLFSLQVLTIQSTKLHSDVLQGTNPAEN